MKFWYTRNVSILLLILVLVLPHTLILQVINSENYMFQLLAPLWQYIIHTPDYVHFAISPFALIYIIWFWPSLLIVKFSYDSLQKDDWTRWKYAKYVLVCIIIQILIGIFIPPASGSPPVVNVPLVFSGLIALLLTRWTVPAKEDIWDEDEQDDVF